VSLLMLLGLVVGIEHISNQYLVWEGMILGIAVSSALAIGPGDVLDSVATGRGGKCKGTSDFALMIGWPASRMPARHTRSLLTMVLVAH